MTHCFSVCLFFLRWYAGKSLAEIEDWRENFYFADAFQLSWTTFSTVVRNFCRASSFSLKCFDLCKNLFALFLYLASQGYGIVFPQVNKQSVEASPDCMMFTFMVSLEAFVGVLFGAFCGSIMFGKIARYDQLYL